jgi:hypothetical protein
MRVGGHSGLATAHPPQRLRRLRRLAWGLLLCHSPHRTKDKQKGGIMNYNKIHATWWSGTCYHNEQLQMIIANTDTKNYAYILHDKDKNDDGELKKPHFHFLIQLQQKQRGSWFKQFCSDDLGIVFAEPCFAPLGAYNYLTHDTPHARKQGKYIYPENERTSTITDFECNDKTDENLELWQDIIELVENRITWYDFIQKKPKRIHMIQTSVASACRRQPDFQHKEHLRNDLL